MAKVKEICEQALKPVIEQAGYELVEVTYQKEVTGMNLIFTIDSDNGVTIDDCEKVHKLIDPILDELNPTDDKPYILSVSSPGIDRPLKTDRDFKRNEGKEIEITLFQKLEGKKKFVGTLKAYDALAVTIEDGGKTLTFDREKIAHIVPVIKF